MKRQPPRTVSNALMILVTVLALGGGFGLGWWFSTDRLEPSVRPTEDDRTPTGKVPGRGRIEPAGGVISLAPGSPDRVALGGIKVKEGDHVKAKQVLIELESLKERQLAKEMAETRLHEAEAQSKAIDQGSAAEVRVVHLQLEQLDALSPFELGAQKRKIDLLKRQRETALANWRRVQGVSGDTISAQDRDQAENLLEQSNTQLEEARIGLKQMETKQKMDRSMLQAKEEAARSKAVQAKSEISLPLLQKRLAQVEEQKEQSLLRAPTAGTVLHILTQEGELVGAKPILEMANVEQMEVNAEIHESFYWRVKRGQTATVTSRIPLEGHQDMTLHGEVISKSRTIGQQDLYGLDPRARRDERVFQVKIRLKDGERASHLIGHQVDVSIDAPPLNTP